MIWGSTFLVVKNTERVTGPFPFLFLCYGIGTVTLAVIFHKHLLRITRSELLNGSLIGVILFAGYALQYTGLQYTITSKAGFITGLYVPLVIVFTLLFLRQRPGRFAIVGIVLSVLGLALISFNDRLSLDFGAGELLILGSAFAFAVYFVAVSKFAVGANAFNLTIVQLGVTALLSLAAMPLGHESFTLQPLPIWGAILYMGVVDVAFSIVSVNWVQQYVSGTRAAFIYSLEPMWVALFGYFLAGESLSIPAKIGCGMIFLGMIVGRAHK